MVRQRQEITPDPPPEDPLELPPPKDAPPPPPPEDPTPPAGGVAVSGVIGTAKVVNVPFAETARLPAVSRILLEVIQSIWGQISKRY